ncbi:adenylyltransferase/cytidyltransferase family protein, partial [Methanothrix sp.]|uniref:adenylyltransferase/cytidyltransferase family protein n=1 Tax=Methanothrix sp. TaxID=90426 RepID=UPI003D09A4FA
RPVVPEDQRLRMVSALKMVDMAVLGSVTDIFEPVRALRPGIITLGYDQYMDENWLEGELRKRGLMARVVRISEREPCELCSSRQIVEKILKERC